MRTRIVLLLLCLHVGAFAHVGSPDVYYDGYAGPYHLLVTVRPPLVIPGLAEIEIRISSDVTQVQIAPLRIVGPGARIAPTPDAAQRSASDPQIFTGKLWIMARGSWKVQLDVDGPKGKGELAVPIAAVSLPASPSMQKSLGGLLAGLGLVLLIGLVGIIRAANRDAALQPGLAPSPSQRRRAFVIAVIAATLLGSALVFGDFWWRADASQTAKLSYKIPHLQLALKSGNVLQLRLQNPNDVEWRQFRSEVEDPDRLRLDDLIPDHGHLMHLFLVRMPDMRSFWHLHPQQVNGAEFSQVLPTLPAGHYRIFSDIVHHTGFPETQVGDIDLPVITGGKLTGDDAGNADLSLADNICLLDDGYRMVWERDSTPLTTGRPIWFRFRIEDKNGQPAPDLENYMGMAGHAAFIRDDGQVFVHVHPAGSISMAAAELARPGSFTMKQKSDMPGMIGTTKMSGVTEMTATGQPRLGHVSFPYGFSQTGQYHIFIQVKVRGKIETAAFITYVAR